MRPSRIVDFSDSFTAADTFPANVVSHSKYAYQLDDYVKQLQSRQGSLFCDTSQCALHVLETQDSGTAPEMKTGCIRTPADLDQHLGSASMACRPDPVCRFAFVTAPHAREKLNVDRTTLMRVLSWHQVMPEFLDFLFSFGRTDHSKDFHFTGFRSEAKLLEADATVYLPELGRSGRELRMCYTIKSVENVVTQGSQRNWPWSIRTTSLYHSFDIATSRSFWLIIKANTLLRGRVKALCDGRRLYRTDLVGEDSRTKQAFDSTLRSHQLLCALAGENWRWYINSIEEKVQDLTRDILTETVDLYKQAPRHAQTWNSIPGTELTTVPSNGPETSRFTFENLQEIHFVEEKTNEALLIIEANMSLLPQT
ncbi:hypothetical protein LTR95_013259 [Oleoguttula sp. CCFEE 5521]